MNKLEKITKIFLKIILLLVFASSAIYIYFIFTDNLSFTDRNLRPSKDERINLQPNFPVTQTLKASGNNITKLRILFQDHYFSAGDKMFFQLADENCSKTITEEEFELEEFDTERFFDFKFEPIPDSKDKIYCLSVTFRPPEIQYENVPTIYVSEDYQFDGQVIYDIYKKKEYKNHSFVMKVAYKKDSIWQGLGELNKRMSQYKPWFLKHYYLWVIAIGFIALSIILTIILILL